MKCELLKNLAINGGPKAVPNPLPPRGSFGQAEKDAMNRVVDEAIAAGIAPIYGGPEEEAFCKEFSTMMGGGFADAVSSGTDAVFVALRALEIEPFSDIVVGPITDPGGFMPIVMNNCIPIVADCRPDSFNVSLDTIKAACTPNTAAIIVPHIAGEPAEIDKICEFARQRGIKVIEDCAQAHGATLNGKRVGTFGDIAAYSMMNGKHTCMGGQGGMVFTKSEALYWKIRQNSDRGKPFGLPAGSSNCVAALNFNADEIGCAIGREQIKKTDKIAAERQRVVKIIAEETADIGVLKMPRIIEGGGCSYWFLRTLFDGSKVSCGKNEFGDALAAESNMRVLNYYPASPYAADWYSNRRVFGTTDLPWSAPQYKGDKTKRFTLADLPNTKKALDDSLLLYVLESWSDDDARAVAGAIRKVYEAYRVE